MQKMQGQLGRMTLLDRSLQRMEVLQWSVEQDPLNLDALKYLQCLDSLQQDSKGLQQRNL